MNIFEIVGGVILLLAAVAIVLLTLMQQSKGKGLSGAITGGNAMGGDSYTSPADRILAKLTKILGVVFFVAAIVACVLSSRLS